MIRMKESVEKLSAYFVNETPYRVKLDANEGSNYLLDENIKIEHIKDNLYADSDANI